MKYHRFLTKIDEVFNKGRYLIVIYGNPSFLSDSFYYKGKRLSLIECIQSFIFDEKKIRNIVNISCSGDVYFIKRNYTTAYKSVTRDDLEEFTVGKEEIFVEQKARAGNEIRNALEMINMELRSFTPKTSAVIFDNFDIASKIYFPIDEEAQAILKNTLLLWKDQTHFYCIFILRTTEIQNLIQYGLERDQFIEVYQPTPQEIAYFLIKESLKQNKIILFPLLHANRYAEGKTTLEKALEDFSAKIKKIATQEICLLDNTEIERWNWSKVKLNKTTKEKIKRIFENFLMGTSKLCGIILYGPPGTGKTTIAKVLADESGLYFKKTSGSDFKGEFLGQSAQMTRRVFEELRALKPAILLIDEADSILTSRKQTSGRGGDTYTLEIVNEFLANIDGLKDDGGIFVVISTNNPEYLDEAIRSRFEMIEVPLPDEETLKELINEYLGEDFLDLAYLLEGYTGRDIKNLAEKIKQLNLSKEELKRLIREEKFQLLQANFEPFKLAFPKCGGFSQVLGYNKQKKTLLEAYNNGIRKFAILGKRKTGKSLVSEAFLAEINFLFVKLTPKTLPNFDYIYSNRLKTLNRLLRKFNIALLIEYDSEPPPEIDSYSEDFIIIINSYITPDIIDDLEARDYTIVQLFIDDSIILELINKEAPYLMEKLSEDELRKLIYSLSGESFISLRRKLKEEIARFINDY